MARNFVVHDISNTGGLLHETNDESRYITLQDQLKPARVQQDLQSYERTYYELPNLMR